MEKINLILGKIFKLPAEKVSENLTMNDIPNWDSLTHMDMIVSIEEEFKIMLSGDDIAEMITFDSIRTVVAKYLKNN